MRIVLFNCFDTYEDRVDLVYNFLKLKGHDVKIVQSNFRHFKKKIRIEEKKDFVFVDSKPYYKNISYSRLSSHYKYAKDAYSLIADLNPDILYTFVPPNSLGKFAVKYKKNNPNVKLIIDIIDLWPETMPLGKIKNLPPFSFWGSMRDNSLKFADLVLTECDLYQEVLKKNLDVSKMNTLYLAKEDVNTTSCVELSSEEINVAYLGSINNIIDINKIVEILKTLVSIKPTTLHIIGDGENRDELINESKATGANIVYYGKVFDPQEKQDIFDKCHFGLNIMKDSVCVGLTMKSIDYFQHGLPIINNIKHDTVEIINKYNIGINVVGDLEELAHFISEENFISDLEKMRSNTLNLFNEQFSVKAFDRNLEKYMRCIELNEKQL